MPALRTLVVDDYEDVRKLLRSILQENTECVVIGEAADGLQAIEQATALLPDLILLDLSLPRLNGMEVGRRIRQLSPNSKIVFLSQDDSPEIVQEALRYAAGYLLKSDATELPAAIDTILRGEVFISHRLENT